MTCPLPLPESFDPFGRTLRTSWSRAFATALPIATDWRALETRCWRIDLDRQRAGQQGGIWPAVRL